MPRILACFLLALCGTAAAQSDVDPTLYSDRLQPGPVAIDFPTLTMETARRVLPLPDGRIVVVGDGDGNPGDPIVPQIALARLLEASSRYTYPGAPPAPLDPEFGKGHGLVTTSFGLQNISATVETAALDSVGRIVVMARATGYTNSTTTYYVMLARFLANGTPDASFGEGGVVLTPQCFGPSCALMIAAASDMTLLPDGSALVANLDAKLVYIDDTTPTIDEVVITLRRYTAEGDLHPGFGTNGVREYDEAPGLDRGFGVGFVRIAQRPAGGFVLAGNVAALDGHPIGPPVLMAFAANGAPQADFGDGGSSVLAPPTLGDRIMLPSAIHVLANGRAILAGTAIDLVDQTYDFATLRTAATGALDAGFGDGGVTLTDFGDGLASVDQATALAVDATGRSYVAGFVSELRDENTRVGLLRLAANGMPDAEFAADGRRIYHELGIVTPPATRVTQERAYAAALAHNGALVVAGARMHVSSPDRSRDAMLVFRLQTVDLFVDGFE